MLLRMAKAFVWGVYSACGFIGFFFIVYALQGKDFLSSHPNWPISAIIMFLVFFLMHYNLKTEFPAARAK
jgi:hypothetical protein